MNKKKNPGIPANHISIVITIDSMRVMIATRMPIDVPDIFNSLQLELSMLA